MWAGKFCLKDFIIFYEGCSKNDGPDDFQKGNSDCYFSYIFFTLYIRDVIKVCFYLNIIEFV